MKRFLTLAGAAAMAAITAMPQQADAISFPVTGSLEFCWEPYFEFPCGFVVPATLYKTPVQYWGPYGYDYGPWEILPGPKVQLNLYPPYDGTVYRGSPRNGCLFGRMVDSQQGGQGKWEFCPY